MRACWKLIFILTLTGNSMLGQNLVQNGSFEDRTMCPLDFNKSQLNEVKSWYQASLGTPDYFHPCSREAGVPGNYFGNEPAQDGNAYMGLVTYSCASRKNYREYVESKLTRPLVAGELVCVELYYSAADKSTYVTDGLGISLSKDNAQSSDYSFLKNANVAMHNPKLHMLSATGGWTKLSDTYRAEGGEQFITIGNFVADTSLKIISRLGQPGAESCTWSYVYIDNVVVRPIKNERECSCENDYYASIATDPPIELSEQEKIKIDNVLFDFDLDQLTDSARIQLNEIHQLLLNNPAMFMEISGHTDEIGSTEYNVELSKRRAERVIQYLADKGINRSRLRIEYFGKSQPTADNTTEEGRHQNRRVEFQILVQSYQLVH
jgi:OOP family OmpA-OmpF porin